MKIELEIPDEFREHWKRDHFEDSFRRIKNDVRFAIGDSTCSSCGLYEIELLDMLINTANLHNCYKEK